jgi:hypothetical protein
MSIHDLSEFLETYNILTYGLHGRRVRIQLDGVFWIRKGHVLKKIEDWSAALEQGQDVDDVKNALMLMGAVISDFRTDSKPKEA